MQTGLGYFAVIVFTVAVLLVIFLILRALMLWYWKVNQVISRLDTIIGELRKK